MISFGMLWGPFCLISAPTLILDIDERGAIHVEASLINRTAKGAWIIFDEYVDVVTPKEALVPTGPNRGPHASHQPWKRRHRR